MSKIEKEFIAMHPNSQSLFQSGQQIFPSGVTHDIRAFRPFPIYVEKADKGKISKLTAKYWSCKAW